MSSHVISESGEEEDDLVNGFSELETGKRVTTKDINGKDSLSGVDLSFSHDSELTDNSLKDVDLPDMEENASKKSHFSFVRELNKWDKTKKSLDFLDISHIMVAVWNQSFSLMVDKSSTFCNPHLGKLNVDSNVAKRGNRHALFRVDNSSRFGCRANDKGTTRTKVDTASSQENPLTVYT